MRATYWQPGSSIWEHWRKRFGLTEDQARERWLTDAHRPVLPNPHLEEAIVQFERLQRSGG